jgi:uncharacterized delta-60 repeat protein
LTGETEEYLLLYVGRKQKIMKATLNMFTYPHAYTAKATSIIACVMLLGVFQSRSVCIADPDFNVNGSGANSSVYAVAINSSGKILIGGALSSVNGTNRDRLAVLNANGTLDNYYAISMSGTNQIYAVAFQPDGKMLIGGAFSTVNSTSRPFLARLTSSGALDSLVVTSLNGVVRAIAIQPDGKILVGGDFTQPKGGILRLNSDGTLDASFAPYGATPGGNESVTTVVVDNNPDSANYRKIYIAGAFGSYGGIQRSKLARLDTNGYVDTGFWPFALNNTVYALALQTVNDVTTVLIGGAFSNDGNYQSSRFARVSDSGAPDASFNLAVNNLVNGTVRAIAAGSVDNIFVGGAFSYVGSNYRQGIAKFSNNGSLNTSWNTGCYGVDADPGVIYSIALQGSNPIVGGAFSHIDGDGHACYDRLLSSGYQSNNN